MDRTAPAAAPATWRPLWAWVRPERARVLASIVLGGLASGFEVASLGLVGVLLQVTETGVTGRLGPFSRVVPLLRGLSPTGQRAVLVALILAGITIRGLAWWGSAAIRERVGARVHGRARRLVFERLARAPLAWLQARGVGEQDTMILHETERLAHATTDVVQLAVYLGMAFWYLALLFYMAPKLTLAALALLFLAGATLRLLRRPVERHALRMREESREMSGAIHETLSGLHLLKLLGRTDDAVSRFASSSEGLLDAKWRQRRALDSIPPVSELLGAVVVLSILWLGSTVLPIRGDADPVQLLPYVLTFYRLLPRFLAIPALRTALSANLSSVGVVDRFLRAPETEPERDGGGAVEAGAHRIALEGVRFRYGPDRPWVLDGVDLDLAPGRTTALVGPSGAGKSTIVDLLLGVRRPVEGRVRVDGRDLADLAGDAWRRRVGVVPQEARLFDRSVRDNLRLVAPDASDERLWAALDAAAAGFVRDLPRGLDATLGERGARLSGGERQRICIARALLMEPSLLVFDEPTSHLDGDAERAVTGALQRAARGRTVLVIAHRLSTVRAADDIVLLRGGRVAERGSHEALLARDGEYARLVRLGVDEVVDPPAPAAGPAGP